MSSLYLECFSGISGDMFVAAMLDLGVEEHILQEALASMPIDGFKVNISRVKKAGLQVHDFDVVLDHVYENHDHDMEYLFGHDHPHAHEHGHEYPHEHVHEHAHEHGSEKEHAHPHPHAHPHEHMHRGLFEVLDIINRTELTEQARAIAVRIFQILGEAEAAAHGTTPEEVHFHEVGAVDSIVDIIAAAVCLDNLQKKYGVDQVVIPVLYEGYGRIRCQHGILPVPVPAVSNIVQKAGLNLRITDTQGELVTPTGAAIAAAIQTTENLPKSFRIQRIGMGAGKREYENPSILRAMIIEERTAADMRNTEQADSIYKLETNLDDCTGESLGYVLDKLMEAGARDVHYTSVYMKKNRPAYQLNVICDECDVEKLEQIIFSETTTIGIRKVKMQRTVMQRRIEEVNTPFGAVKVKVCSIHGIQKIYPEYNSVMELCRKNRNSFQEMFQIAEMYGYEYIHHKNKKEDMTHDSEDRNS